MAGLGKIKMKVPPPPETRMWPPPPADMKLAQLTPQIQGAGLVGAPPPGPALQPMTPMTDPSAGMPQVAPGGPQPAAQPQAAAAPMVDPYTAQYTAMYRALNPQISLGEQEMGKLEQARNTMLDTALNGGMTKQERAEAKVGGIFSDVIAPIAGLLGGNGTASGALSFINQEKQDLALKKAQAKANQTAAFSALKGLYDIYGKVDPNSLQQHGAQMKATISAMAKDTAHQDKMASAVNTAAENTSKDAKRKAEIKLLEAKVQELPKDSLAKREAESALAGLRKAQTLGEGIENKTRERENEAQITLMDAQGAAATSRATTAAANAKVYEKLSNAQIKLIEDAKTPEEKAKAKKILAETGLKEEELGAIQARKEARAAESGILRGKPPAPAQVKHYAQKTTEAIALDDARLKEWSEHPQGGAAIGMPKEYAEDPVKARKWLRHYQIEHLEQ